jgi:16S rRNA (uracil1498-N3)-methyltransferase
MDLVVQKTTELGVARIVPVGSERGMVKAGIHQQRRWQKIAEEASRQSGRADMPLVSPCLGFAAAVAQAASAPGERFAHGEVTRAKAAGFVAVGLGPRILRSETAAIVAVALAQAAAGGLGGGPRTTQ